MKQEQPLDQVGLRLSRQALLSRRISLLEMAILDTMPFASSGHDL